MNQVPSTIFSDVCELVETFLNRSDRVLTFAAWPLTYLVAAVQLHALVAGDISVT